MNSSLRNVGYKMRTSVAVVCLTAAPLAQFLLAWGTDGLHNILRYH